MGCPAPTHCPGGPRRRGHVRARGPARTRPAHRRLVLPPGGLLSPAPQLAPVAAPPGDGRHQHVDVALQSRGRASGVAVPAAACGAACWHGTASHAVRRESGHMGALTWKSVPGPLEERGRPVATPALVASWSVRDPRSGPLAQGSAPPPGTGVSATSWHRVTARRGPERRERPASPCPPPRSSRSAAPLQGLEECALRWGAPQEGADREQHPLSQGHPARLVATGTFWVES